MSPATTTGSPAAHATEGPATHRRARTDAAAPATAAATPHHPPTRPSADTPATGTTQGATRVPQAAGLDAVGHVPSLLPAVDHQRRCARPVRRLGPPPPVDVVAHGDHAAAGSGDV